MKYTQIKIFTDNDAETVVNQWLGRHPEVTVTSVTSEWTQDYYDTGEICSQYLQTIVIYTFGDE